MKVKPSHKPGRVVLQLDRQDEGILSACGETQPTRSQPLRLRRILVPIDFSACSQKALEYAIPFAKQFGASLVLLHVVPVDHPVGEFGALDFSTLEAEMRRNAEKQMTALLQDNLQGQVSAESFVRLGRPAYEIVSAAKELEIDLIIMSTHGRTGLKHVFLGSTTESVVRYSPCPMLTVRERQHDFITRPTQPR